MAKIIFYDVETTGTNYMKHSIIEMSGIIEIDGEVKQTFNFRVKPHPKAAIEDGALAVNGHKREELPTYPEMSVVHETFTNILSEFVDKYDKTDKFHLAGFNNRGFDDNFLRMFFTLNGDNFFGAYFCADSIDATVLASKHLMDVRHTMPSFKLHRVAKTLGIEVDDSRLHEALYDAELAREIYHAIDTESLL